jgi:hypothetical protein
VSPLFQYLRAWGLIRWRHRPIRVTQAEPYPRYLVVERGLVASTARRYVSVVRPFVEFRKTAAGLNLGQLRPRDVTGFVVRSCHVRRGQDVVTALRSLLGLLQLGPPLKASGSGHPGVAQPNLQRTPFGAAVCVGRG